MACRKQGLLVNSRDVNKFVGYNLKLLRLTHSTLRGVFYILWGEALEVFNNATPSLGTKYNLAKLRMVLTLI